jgi:hypothetical protein
VGPGGRDEAGKLIPIDLKAGDRVLFGKWSGTEVKIDGVEYLNNPRFGATQCARRYSEAILFAMAVLFVVPIMVMKFVSIGRTLS